MHFWRDKAYQDLFHHLDHAGGFYYEVCYSFLLHAAPCLPRNKRWGDAPVHSIAAALFLNKNQIHFFDEIGYQHDDWSHCPSNPTPQMACACDPASSFGALRTLYLLTSLSQHTQRSRSKLVQDRLGYFVLVTYNQYIILHKSRHPVRILHLRVQKHLSIAFNAPIELVVRIRCLIQRQLV